MPLQRIWARDHLPGAALENIELIDGGDWVKKYSVYVTRSIPEPGLDLLRRECDHVWVRPSEKIPTKEELIRGVRRCDALLSLLTDRVDSDVIAAGRRLRIIANYAVGYDNIDVEAATRKGVMVTNTPGVLTETTADMAWALLMSVARRIVEADSYVRKGRFRGWAPKLLLGSDVHGKTLGIVGLGRIGRAVAARAKGFQMKVLYYDVRRAEPDVERELGAAYVDLETLLRTSDFVTLHTQLTQQTTHLIGPKELAMMKPTAYLVNTSRGPVVDEKALAKALQAGAIAGAALDVFEKEPDVSRDLLALPNVVLAPHIASASVETRTRMAIMAAENIIAAAWGQTPPNLVNAEVLQRYPIS